MNHLAACVQRPMYCDLLAFELLYLILVVNVIDVIAGGILEHVLVARLYDGRMKGRRIAQVLGICTRSLMDSRQGYQGTPAQRRS